MATQQAAPLEAFIGPLREQELDPADRVFRLAFGTFLGLPDPMQFFGDADYVRTRWRSDPSAALGATIAGELVGSNFATHWGSVGFFGPLTVRPDFWDRGIARRLLEPTMQLFDRWGTRHAGLFTFAHSPKHIALYQKFGFWPRFLTAVMSRPVRVSPAMLASKYSELSPDNKKACLDACRDLTSAIYDGLDLGREIAATDSQRLGDTLLVWEGSRAAAFAVCHCGPRTEAGSDTCYVKFGAVRPGPQADRDFDRLLEACTGLAASRGCKRLVAGTNMARSEAYRRMLDLGFRTDFQGVTMHRPNEPGYSRSGVYLLDDWR